VKLILFDIDGTILWSDGAGRRAMEGALGEIFGAAGSTGYHYDGKTDMQIVRDLMRLEGHDDESIDARMAALLDRYLERLVEELDAKDRRIQRFHGVLELIDALEAREDCIIGLLTGNLERGAQLKLRAVGLAPERFIIGAFGSDHEIRAELPQVAQRRAFEQLGVAIDGSAIIIVGDTPADIACGRPIGARTIAVATGRYSTAELAAHDPFAVFADLRDTAAILRAIDDA
jgi:phosphoglycolate phosphatase